MTPEKIKAALDLCIGEIIAVIRPWKDSAVEIVPTRFPSDKIPQNEDDLLLHAWWMAEEAKKYVDEGRLEKAQRWLGFVQGTMWCAMSITVDQMKNMNKPEEDLAAPLDVVGSSPE